MQSNFNPESISKHMLSLGLGALAHANYHAHLYSVENDKWSELSVLQAGHAAEILIKARISQEHPLLIFEQLPNWTVRSSEGVKEKMDSQAQRDWECPKLANNQYR